MAEAGQRSRLFGTDGVRGVAGDELTASLAQGDAARGAVDSADKAVASAEEAYRVTDAALKAGAATTTSTIADTVQAAYVSGIRAAAEVLGFFDGAGELSTHCQTGADANG